MDRQTAVLRFVRWGFIVLFIVSWPYLVNGIGKRIHLTDHQLIYWRSTKYRIAIWLVLFELLINENIIYKLAQISGMFT